jgi:hypothetical protein
MIHNIDDIKVNKYANKYIIETDIDFAKSFIYKGIIDVIETDTSITIKANNITSLKEYLNKNNNKLDYKIIVNMLEDIILTMNNLESNGYMFVNLKLDDIIVVNNDKFLFINYNNIYKLKDNKISIENIIENITEFIPSNEFNQQSIPYLLEIETLYYNIANILIYCLFNTKYDNNPLTIYPIINTKLYWFLERCLKINKEERVFLYV